MSKTEEKKEETIKQPTQEEMQAFIDEMIAVQKKHGLSLEPSLGIKVLKQE